MLASVSRNGHDGAVRGTSTSDGRDILNCSPLAVHLEQCPDAYLVLVGTAWTKPDLAHTRAIERGAASSH